MCYLAVGQLRRRQGEGRDLPEARDSRGDCLLFYEGLLKSGGCKFPTPGMRELVDAIFFALPLPPSTLTDFSEQNISTQWRLELLAPSPVSPLLPPNLQVHLH